MRDRADCALAAQHKSGTRCARCLKGAITTSVGPILRLLVSTTEINEAAATMALASDLVQITPSLFTWQAYDRAVKADLFSSAIVTARGILLVDPIPLERESLDDLAGSGGVAGIVVTNGNHLRATTDYSAKFSRPIFATTVAFCDASLVFRHVADGDKISDELRVIEIEGAGIGEIALYHEAADGTLIVGDALINFEPYGFTFLPAKYCSNEKEMRRSLRKLLAYKAERMLFAHGLPILSRASERLQGLLESDL